MASPRRGLLVCLLVLLVTACGRPGLLPPPAATVTLLPYDPPTTTATLRPIPATIEPLATPAPTPTPLTHLVESGDTLLGIAGEYGVSLDDLLLANPGIDPGLLRIGQGILIPGPEGQPVGILAPTPTPVSIDYSTPTCYRTPAGAYWCLVLVTNPTQTAVEGITALVTLVDRSGVAMASAAAVAPLNLLPAGGALPLAAYFPSPDSVPLGAEFLPVSALEVGSVEERYLPVVVERTVDEPGPERSHWRVRGSLALGEAASAAAGRLVIVLVAFDETGGLAGFTAEQLPSGLAPGETAAFDLTVFSLGPAIDRVDVLAEAQPPAASPE